MSRVLLIVLDSVGIGGAADAHVYGDAGADTVGHIADFCASQSRGPLNIPNLCRLGLGLACQASTGKIHPGLDSPRQSTGLWGYGVEVAWGKDTPSGHWEIAGVPVRTPWGTFPDTHPAFPEHLTKALIHQAGLPGVLGNCHASGTDIIEKYGYESLNSGQPIIYTSVDSVMQIAAHEDRFGLDRLYDLCERARRLCDPLRIGRVIARPFIGTSPKNFQRTANRKDFAMPPPEQTLLDIAVRAGRSVTSVGKIGDIFSHRGTGTEIKAHGNEAVLTAALDALHACDDGGLVFANLVDFDTEYGHRRDAEGYAKALEAFDKRIPEIEAALKSGDIAIITADHGNDPTWRGTDHTREHVPILVFGPDVKPGNLGRRDTLADIGASIASYLKLEPLLHGKSFLRA